MQKTLPPDVRDMREAAQEPSIAIVGAGPVGLALALHVANLLPNHSVSLFDARPLDRDVLADARVLALSVGSINLLTRLRAWPTAVAEPIVEVVVSQQASGDTLLGGVVGESQVNILARREGVAMLGAVIAYGRLVGALQDAWLTATARDPQRLRSRFGTAVSDLKHVPGGVEVDAGIAERFDLVVVAEGGVFSQQARKAISRDYGQTAWVGTVDLAPDLPAGVAYERFTRHGPVALLPLPGRRASLVWCVTRDEDPVHGLDDSQRLAVLNTLFPAAVGRIRGVSSLKRFDLGLNAELTLSDGRIVRIGNAAQTLHPVAGQGLNLGLRDAGELVRMLRREKDIDSALRRLEWSRAPDRWSVIAATDFLARSFTWDLPGAGIARGLGLAALQALSPLKSALARQMMFGSR